jgi:transcriptional regulator with XRE-family HTH domain
MPLCYGAASEPEIVSQFSKAAATAPKDGKWGHASCLHQVSRPRKSKMLTHREQALGQNGVMEIGLKIKTAREEAGFSSQHALAKAIGVSRGLVGGWENHTKVPGRERLIRVARATAKPLSYFIGDVAPDKAVLETKDPDEIDIIILFRTISAQQRRTHLRQAVDVRAEIEAKGKPAKGKPITV